MLAGSHVCAAACRDQTARLGDLVLKHLKCEHDILGRGFGWIDKLVELTHAKQNAIQMVNVNGGRSADLRAIANDFGVRHDLLDTDFSFIDSNYGMFFANARIKRIDNNNNTWL
jgi:hypothetical protein